MEEYYLLFSFFLSFYTIRLNYLQIRHRADRDIYYPIMQIRHCQTSGFVEVSFQLTKKLERGIQNDL